MSRTSFRAAAGLTAALSLAVVAWPATAGGDEADDAVRTASVSDPVVMGLVPDGSNLRTPASVLADVTAQVAGDIVEARIAVQHLEAVSAWQAGEAKAEAERLWIANEEAAEALRVEEARQAEAARQAEEQRAAAAAPAGSLEAIIQRHFGDAAPAAIRIARCESGMNPNAVSPTNDHGLFQINIVHRGQFEAVTGAPWSAIYDPELNTIYARHVYAQQGWSPWTCAR